MLMIADVFWIFAIKHSLICANVNSDEEVLSVGSFGGFVGYVR